ncbi:phage tail assembly protein [Candidatus Haliotispira prima]|uniref:Phage tail assembly protein n=1 Tax=Candidatus Haliotispira prima TaxID=3034016 RepID=A0ABY8MEF3_9SPIO|nr:phage tail assembly protein [Candidatus Haliotispira prima]
MKVIKIVKLKKGLEIGEDFVEELQFREPTVAALLAADSEPSGTYGEEVALMSALCGVDRRHLAQMGLADYSRCREIVAVISVMIDRQLDWDAAQMAVSGAMELMAEDGGSKPAGKSATAASPSDGAVAQSI